jgi:hypothetical protein
LAAAQARAVAALAKQYVAGTLEADAVRSHLTAIGLADEVDTDRWLFALDTISAAGGEAPSEAKPTEPKKDEPASDAQWSLIRKLADERTLTAPTGPLSKAQAHEVIDSIKGGTYTPDEWVTPF